MFVLEGWAQYGFLVHWGINETNQIPLVSVSLVNTQSIFYLQRLSDTISLISVDHQLLFSAIDWHK